MKRIIFAFFAFIFIEASAQNSVSMYPLLNVGKINSPTFSAFLDNYQAYNAASITGTSGMEPGISVGFGIRYVMEGHLLIPAEYSRAKSSVSIQLNEGSERKFDFSSGGFSFGLGYAIPSVTNPFYVYPEFGMSLGKDRIKSSFSDASGTYNPEALNGDFNEFSGKIFAGFGTAVGLKTLKITGRIQYFFPVASSELDDEDKTLNNYGTQYIPVDYAEWLADPVDYFGPTVKDDFKGLKISVGIVLEIPASSDY